METGKRRNYSWLLQQREAMNMLQKDVAKKAKVSRQFYAMVKNGQRYPSPGVAVRIAKALNREDDWYTLLNTSD